MNKQRLSQLLILTVALSGLAACGGGGGGGGSPAPAPTPSGPAPGVPPIVNGLPPYPLEAATGLPYPSLTLQQTLAEAIELAQTAAQTYAIADEASAAVQLGQEVPGIASTPTTPAPCSAGGTIGYVARATGTPGYSYTYTDCKSAAFTFGGTGWADTTNSPTSYLVGFNALTAQHSSGWSQAITGLTTCKPGTGGAPAKCTASIGGFFWGYDNTYDYTTQLAGGSHQCDCGKGTWNVVFDAFGPVSGNAYVYATNGGAKVTRTGANTFTVVLTVNSVTETYFVTI